MPPGPSVGMIEHFIPAARSYVHFNDPPASGHNDHQVLGWAVLDDSVTVVPIIASTDDATNIVQASQISTNYVILNPYSQCTICVRPAT